MSCHLEGPVFVQRPYEIFAPQIFDQNRNENYNFWEDCMFRFETLYTCRRIFLNVAKKVPLLHTIATILVLRFGQSKKVKCWLWVPLKIECNW